MEVAQLVDLVHWRNLRRNPAAGLTRTATCTPLPPHRPDKAPAPAGADRALRVNAVAQATPAPSRCPRSRVGAPPPKEGR